jgi:shikimate dehydrogenase
MVPDKYAVMGNPVLHSKSPTIHSAFAKQTKQHLHYTAIEVPLGSFQQQVMQFQSENGKGLNVTVPFKQQAFELVTQHSDRALQARSVNTIKFLSDGSLFGDNTDGLGLICDIMQHHHYRLENKRILILGAGGVARGILSPILEQNPLAVIIANRTLTKAQRLAIEFAPLGQINAMPFSQLESNYDLIIHCLSLGHESGFDYLPDSIITKSTFCYDVKYGQELTPFLKWAQEKGAEKLADGTGMLVEQAAEAFYIWRGVRPATKSVIALLNHAKTT